MQVSTSASRGSAIRDVITGAPGGWYSEVNPVSGTVRTGSSTGAPLASINLSPLPTTKTTEVRGYRPPTAWERTCAQAESTVPSQKTFRTSSGWNRTTYSNSTPTTTNLSDLVAMGTEGEWGNLTSNASVGARLKLLDMDVDFGVALAESRESIQTLAASSYELVRIATWAKQGKWKRIGEHFGVTKRSGRTKTLSQRWLEYSFGWKPIIADIHGTAEMIKEGFGSKDQTFHIIKRESDSVRKMISGTGTWATEVSVNRSVEIGFTAKLLSPKIAALASMGLINPASIAWELVPFSFVFDWFMPIGNFLSSLTATLGYSYVGGYRTRRAYVDEDVSYNSVSATGTLLSQSDGVCKVQTQRMVRNVMGSFPIPLPYLTQSPLTTKRAVTSIALLNQLLRR